ncbi:unnamed protein product [Bursaphelenchus okinawaensis]|uniref:G-protein coupled receptors family 1 profile domain-containing protein n=1 Tax=Bursaphelenchus okinawaensis TaxID=465554 RepID=A0A811LA57_9BILA|nr:unnamed protein product [Bursaphelenchus okinawaensis]CAG9119898.1 unnamed protein product [Bursaphelenchus okinawaensis]
MDTADHCQTVVFQLPNESMIYDRLADLHAFYKPIHTYLSIVLCALGAVCNFCNIVVLTRRQMRTPVNMILTAMACCDTVVLFSNLIYTTHYTFVAFANCHPRHWSYGWALFLVSHAHLSLVGHTSSVWLSVMLALIRYLTLRNRGRMSGMQIGLKHSYISIAAVIFFVLIMNSPNFLTYKIIEMPLKYTCTITDPSVTAALAYFPEVSDLALETNCLVFRMAFWISGTIFKVLPCMLLTLFVWLLTRILNEVKENRARLLKGSVKNGNSVQPNGLNRIPDVRKDSNQSLAPLSRNIRSNSIRGNRASGRADRTTRMLLAIVCVFLVTELPQGIMAVLIGLLSQEFRKNVYNNVGDILDLLSLCEACTSFIIYCSMSGQFRNEFRRVFIPAQVSCWWSPQTARRYSDALFSKTGNQFLQVDQGNATDRSITMSLVEMSKHSARRLSADKMEESPSYSRASSSEHRRSTQFSDRELVQSNGQEMSYLLSPTENGSFQ